MSEEATIKIEPMEYPQVKLEIDDCVQVKQEIDDCDHIYPEYDEVFVKSEITIQEEIKEETIKKQDAVSNANICKEENSMLSNLDDNTFKYNERVLSKSKHNLKTHKCKICKKSYTTRQNLQRHEMIHTTHHYKCEICNKSLYSK
ncbi:zinc finger protein 184-like [Ctenocephalides felis]|uniref:zinc finger protein 184-like n=1 Tax=Ctenocephalides felis TaxID=7515 RepID=UPI000E6E5264|nr:zinc finger protein 184-like [Ctenocephalides felis]